MTKNKFMKDVSATAKFLRISPRKMRLSTTLVVGKPIAEATKVLQFTPRKGAALALKLLKSAQANATNTHNLDGETLVVKSFAVNQGPVLKRFRPRSRGRAEMQRKPTSHATIVVTGKPVASEEKKSDNDSVKTAKKTPAKKPTTKKK